MVFPIPFGAVWLCVCYCYLFVIDVLIGPSLKLKWTHNHSDCLPTPLCCRSSFFISERRQYNALCTFQTLIVPEGFSQSCEVQLPGVSDHRPRLRWRAHKPAALAMLKDRISHKTSVLRITPSNEDAFMYDMKKFIAVVECF